MDEGMAVVVAVALLGLPIGGWIVVRGMEHTERMEMIRRGMMPPPYVARLHNAPNLTGAFALVMVSVMLLAFAFAMAIAAIALPAEGSGQIPSWFGAVALASTAIALASVFCLRAVRGQKRIKDAGASLMIVQKK
jgi:hypothetical protein